MPDLLHRRDLAVDPFVLAGVHMKLECHAHHGIAVAAQTATFPPLNTGRVEVHRLFGVVVEHRNGLIFGMTVIL